MNGVNEIRETEFKKDVLESNVPVLVDFYAPWCGPCRAMAPVLEGLAGAYAGRAKIVKVNVDDAGALAVQLGIRSIPALFLYQGGRVVDQMIGVTSAGVLRAKLDAAVASDQSAAVSD